MISIRSNKSNRIDSDDYKEIKCIDYGFYESGYLKKINIYYNLKVCIRIYYEIL